ncbi:calcium/proton exchanger [Leucogyrophana mollusca]|uniref:Calcium/proton exchanger n=1 Tax=Leucogyrophana mollusca TaxID=85980 RepID=A0ACB8BRB7_9AGAM|nr:calcium/proton exchanger [Leucogyrophana mollusca]
MASTEDSMEQSGDQSPARTRSPMLRHTADDAPHTPPRVAVRASSGAVRSRKTTADDSQRRITSLNLRRVATTMLQPEKKLGPPPSAWRSIRSIILASWLNVLLVFIPISWALNFALPDQQTLIFVFAFLAIIPLAKLLAFATDELSMRVGQTLAGLLNATLGNAVELIVAIIALVKCELSIVQSSLVGSILSNLLLVLGMCFFAGGLRFSEQGFGQSAVQLNSSLLTISVIAVLLPGAFHFALSQNTSQDEGTIDQEILKTSHGVAIILLFIYASYLVFQLFSHKALYDDANEDILISKKYDKNPFVLKRHRKNASAHDDGRVTDGILMTSPINTRLSEEGTPLPAEGGPEDVESGHSDEQDEETPQMSVPVCLGLLIVVTVLVAVTAEFLVDSINGLTDTGHIGKEFVGVILLPIVGNAAEHVTAVTVSVKDKLTLSLGVAVGSSIQIALFVIPFIITLGWILGKPLTLLFDPLESVVLFLAVLTVNYCVQDGKSNWLEGMILMCLYLILGVTFWFYPGTDGIFTSC